jgi:hypothetical protein
MQEALAVIRNDPNVGMVEKELPYAAVIFSTLWWSSNADTIPLVPRHKNIHQGFVSGSHMAV